MHRFISLWTLNVLVMLPTVVSSRCNHVRGFPDMKHNICVSFRYGNDSRKCLQDPSLPCKHLKYVLENIQPGQNSTAVYVDVGYYKLNKSYAFWNVNYFAIIGLPSPDLGDVKIQCEGNAGLSFIYSTSITIEGVILSSCGAVQNSTSTGHTVFLTGLFLVNCINFSMDNVHVWDSPGIGMQFYDVTGTVTISNSSFLRNGRRTQGVSELSIPGGGFYFEFTFRGGLYPFNTPPQHIYQENGVFNFINVAFEDNSSPKTRLNDTVYPGGKDHIAFGRGGGASFFIKGSAQNNTFLFQNCYFHKNYAVWGAGVFVEFQDTTKGNNIQFNICHFSDNNVSLAGGAARIGLITMHQTINCIPNTISFTSCHFKRNHAVLGGAVSLHGTTKYSYSHLVDKSFVNFTKCVIKENFATVGSAITTALQNTNDYDIGGGAEPLKLFIWNSIISGNRITHSKDKKVSGTGALYAQGTPIFLSHTQFISNTQTAMVLDNAFVKIIGNVSFIKNTGQRGGAISLYGLSKIKVSNMANLTFRENNCSVQGGAIYISTPGPHMVAFKSTQLALHDCFFSVTNCNCSVSFYGNRGSTNSSGHSVYATTLQFCRKPNEDRMDNTTLVWPSFHYYFVNGTKSDMVNEIVTDAVEMKVNGTDWNTTADKPFSPVVKLYDEKSNSVFGVISIDIKSNDNNKISLDPPSTYFLAKDKIETLKIKAKPKTHYNVSLLTVDSQLVFQEILHAEITDCNPGFVWKQNSCKCDETNIGVSRCDEQNLFLLKGYWGGNASGKFEIIQCPENYCYCYQNSYTSSGECLFNKSKICNGNRERQLCGVCKKGFSLGLGKDKCTKECNSGSQKWIGTLFAILLFLTVLVFIILYINFDPFSAYLNAWLYFYQVLMVLVPNFESLDPFLTFIIGLAHMQILGVDSVCMWSNIDDLQKLAFNYLLPFFVFICLCVLHKVTVAWPNNFVTRQLTHTSLARAFSTLFVLFYSNVVYVSLNIISPIKIDDNYFVFYQGTVEYFDSYHASFAIVAFILLIFVGIFFPLILIRRQWFSFIDNGLKRLLLDNLQRCYRDGYKWCAGYYFVCRFILLVVDLTVPQSALRVSLFNSIFCIVLAVFVFCQPYAEDGGNIVPYRILNISDAVLLCNMCLISSFSGAASGVYATKPYRKGFVTVISILSYLPLLFLFGLFAYVLFHKYQARNTPLTDVD